MNADAAKLRAWWAHRQGLDGSLAGKPPAEVLARAGWARSVGGAGPYLSLFARAGTSREDADRAVESLAICELPSARGCTYVLPAADFALGLACGKGASAAELRVAAKAGVTAQEISRLETAVKRALAGGPLDPDQLKRAVGDAARSLGPEGAKRGVANTLPLALGSLQESGDIRRIATNGRLDQQRYKYAVWRPNPLAGSPLDAVAVGTELARRYFRWIGPATLAEFQWFSGLGVKAAKQAVEPLKLVRFGEDRWMFADDLEAFQRFHTPKKPDYHLVSGLDSHILLRRDVKLLMEPADAERQVRGEKAMVAMGGITDLPSPAILDRGRIAGLWEYDPATESIAWQPFVPETAALREAVAQTEAFVRDQLGDARSFSLDSPKSRQPRIDALREKAR